MKNKRKKAKKLPQSTYRKKYFVLGHTKRHKFGEAVKRNGPKKAPRKIPLTQINRYKKEMEYSWYEQRFWGSRDACRELDFSQASVLQLMGPNGTWPQAEMTLVNQRAFYEHFWIYRLTVDSYKYAIEMKKFDGTYKENKGGGRNREYFKEYFMEHLSEYKEKYEHYVF